MVMMMMMMVMMIIVSVFIIGLLQYFIFIYSATIAASMSINLQFSSTNGEIIIIVHYAKGSR